ncbi:hypothetical protein OPV22_030496 [Ensete ventricosum]|uniref:Uncharacterized protein n=1 Tax=Ensete ventricosum TaxID=4639 RepID=A0AAV8Q9Z9_ENSVE|nr:hypothetical protein OPV22_030496 [Ensete ventricosum]
MTDRDKDSGEAEGVRRRVRLRRPLPRRKRLQVQNNGSGGECGSGARCVQVPGALQLRSLRLRSYGLPVGGRTGGVHVRTGVHLRAVFDVSLRQQSLPEPCHACLLE